MRDSRRQIERETDSETLREKGRDRERERDSDLIYLLSILLQTRPSDSRTMLDWGRGPRWHHCRFLAVVGCIIVAILAAPSIFCPRQSIGKIDPCPLDAAGLGVLRTVLPGKSVHPEMT